MGNKLVVGNWKDNSPDINTLIPNIVSALRAASKVGGVICPPDALIGWARQQIQQADAEQFIHIGSQNCGSVLKQGAHTGDTSPEILKRCGAKYVIVGHSERRAGHGETNEIVAAKARAAIDAGLIPIICVGETAAERGCGDDVAQKTVAKQVKESLPEGISANQVVIAYEPVWAIGAQPPVTPTNEQIVRMHAAIQEAVTEKNVALKAAMPPILYGGSVNERNAEEILGLKGVGGALVGGASLVAEKFSAIIAAGQRCAGIAH